MPISAAQREQRKEHLGSSDMAAVLGLDPRRTPYDIWLEKTGKLEDKDETSDAMYAGTMFENGVLDHAESVLGPLERNCHRSAKDRGIPLAANVDAIVLSTGAPVEAKTTGLFGPVVDTWGDEGTDEVPERVIIQATVHMICVAQDICHVPAFIGGRGFAMFVVPRDETISNVVSETAVQFWEKHVLADIPPDDSLPTAKIIKRIRRMPESIIDIEYHYVQRWLDAKTICKSADEEKENAEREMLAALGQNEGGATIEGLLTYYKQSRATVDGKALKAEMPDVYDKFIRISEFRVPRFKVHKK